MIFFRLGKHNTSYCWSAVLEPLEEGRATHPSVLAWRIAGTRGAWQGSSLWGGKESDTTE